MEKKQNKKNNPFLELIKVALITITIYILIIFIYNAFFTSSGIDYTNPDNVQSYLETKLKEEVNIEFELNFLGRDEITDCAANLDGMNVGCKKVKNAYKYRFRGYNEDKTKRIELEYHTPYKNKNEYLDYFIYDE